MYSTTLIYCCASLCAWRYFQAPKASAPPMRMMAYRPTPVDAPSAALDEAPGCA
jgi:hypothetical protein